MWWKTLNGKNVKRKKVKSMELHLCISRTSATAAEHKENIFFLTICLAFSKKRVIFAP